jgi:hypothetical protein
LTSGSANASTDATPTAAQVTVRDRPGKIYEAYVLDLSQYSGERKRRDLTMIGFSKTGSEDELRRRALIYEPSDLVSTTAGGGA